MVDGCTTGWICATFISARSDTTPTSLPVVDHREVAVAVLGELVERLLHGEVGRRAVDGLRHPLADLGVGGRRAGGVEADEVALGEDADRPLAVDDDDRALLALGHPLRHLRDALGGLAGDRRGAHHLGDRADGAGRWHAATLPSRGSAANTATNRQIRQRSPDSRHAAHPARVGRVIAGANVAPVNPLTTFVRSLGNDGALANARTVLDARRHEDWLVQGLARRLESIGPDVPRRGAAAASATRRLTPRALTADGHRRRRGEPSRPHPGARRGPMRRLRSVPPIAIATIAAMPAPISQGAAESPSPSLAASTVVPGRSAVVVVAALGGGRAASVVVVAFGSATRVSRGAGLLSWPSPSSSLDPRDLALGRLLDGREQHHAGGRRELRRPRSNVLVASDRPARPRHRVLVCVAARRPPRLRRAPRPPTRPRAAARRGRWCRRPRRRRGT